MRRKIRNWLYPSFLSLSLGARMALCKDSHQECQAGESGTKGTRELKTVCWGEGPRGSGFLDIGAPKPNQTPRARLL